MAEDLVKRLSKEGVKFVQLLFVDITGRVKSVTLSPAHFVSSINDGVNFDGSSVEGFARICESDMVLKPDVGTFAILPSTTHKTAIVFCDAYTPEGKPFEGDPRFILRQALEKAEKLGYTFKVGPELEFYMFNKTDSDVPEPHDAGAYFDFSPIDLGGEIRKDVMIDLESMGIQTEVSHHECGPGQHEIDLRYGDAMTLANRVLIVKNLVRLTAAEHNLFASFMPKPVKGIAGSGMHVHQSLWKNGKNSFADASNKYGLSDTARHFLGGQLVHAAALTAIVAPTVNSYKRLVSGYEAPVHICWGRRNRSALIRVPEHSKERVNASRMEFRACDPSCNPYLAFAALLTAGLDGIENRMEPPEPIEEDVYAFDDSELAKLYINNLPENLFDATVALESDKVVRDCLGEFTFGKFIAAKRMEWNDYKIQVTGWELSRYFPII